MNDAVWGWLGNINNVLGLGTFGFSLYAAYRLRQEVRLRAERARALPPLTGLEDMIERYKGIHTEKPVALAICLLPHHDRIRSDVDLYLGNQGWKMPVREINQDGINGTPDLIAFVNALREARRSLAVDGFTEVHLFFAGPGAAAPLVGSVFANWVPVKLYHKPSPNPPQIYDYWMPLVR